MPVLYGVFLYMGVASLNGLQFFDRKNKLQFIKTSLNLSIKSFRIWIKWKNCKKISANFKLFRSIILRKILCKRYLILIAFLRFLNQLISSSAFLSNITNKKIFYCIEFRILLLFMPKKYQPDYPYLRQVQYITKTRQLYFNTGHRIQIWIQGSKFLLKTVKKNFCCQNLNLVSLKQRDYQKKLLSLNVH